MFIRENNYTVILNNSYSIHDVIYGHIINNNIKTFNIIFCFVLFCFVLFCFPITGFEPVTFR